MFALVTANVTRCAYFSIRMCGSNSEYFGSCPSGTAVVRLSDSRIPEAMNLPLGSIVAETRVGFEEGEEGGIQFE